MGEDLINLIESEISDGSSPYQIKEKLLQKGFLEEDVDIALKRFTAKNPHTNKLVRLLTSKEISDRMGYGFVPHQFINVLFYLTGAGYLWLGIVNGAKTILSIVLSSMFQEHAKFSTLGKKVISKSGYLFGFSFLGMAFATLAQSVPLFTLFLLLGSIGVVTHGDLYNSFVKDHLKKERMSNFLAKIAQYGVIITVVSMLISGWLMDKFPVMGSETIMFLGKSYPLYGYLISFEITAIAFILSGHFLAHIKEDPRKTIEAKGFFGDYLRNMKTCLTTFLRHKHLFLLIVTTILFGFSQVLGNSYYGVFIYENFKNTGLGGFMNIAAIFSLAIIVSLLGPWFCKKMQKHIGLAPTLVFGTLLVAIMPLTLAYNPNILAISAANSLAVVGAAILGTSQGLLARRLLRDNERKIYFSVASMAAVIPFLIFIPLGSFYAEAQGLIALFKILGGLLLFIVAPIYIILVFLGNKNKL